MREGIKETWEKIKAKNCSLNGNKLQNSRAFNINVDVLRRLWSCLLSQASRGKRLRAWKTLSATARNRKRLKILWKNFSPPLPTSSLIKFLTQNFRGKKKHLKTLLHYISGAALAAKIVCWWTCEAKSERPWWEIKSFLSHLRHCNGLWAQIVDLGDEYRIKLQYPRDLTRYFLKLTRGLLSGSASFRN